MAWKKDHIDKKVIEDMVACVKSSVPLHTSEVARMIGRSDNWVRFVASMLIDEGRGSELTNLQSYIRGTKKRISYIESLEFHRGTKVERVNEAAAPCRWCGLSGQLTGRKRTVCDSCQVDHDLGHNNPDHTRTWRDDPRWQAITAKRHQEHGGCLVCGSSRSKERDGRYCDWRHDPVMLSAYELEELLERYAASAKRYDIWGNVLR
jgi:hypothetical protein